MVREAWLNLNGPWEYAIVDRDAERVAEWEGVITVPFPVESYLSGVQRRVGPEKRLWYRKTFKSPALEKGSRLLLHFGAVDWEANVWVNGRHVGVHRGGFVPFTFDITDALAPGGDQELIVAVWDPTDHGDQARGKQSMDPKGIWYEPVTGIWQTVWLEPVPPASVADLRIVPDVDSGQVRVAASLRGGTGAERVRFTVRDEGKAVAAGEAGPAETVALTLPEPKLWWPDRPYLYDLTVEVVRDGDVVDRVTSYFGMRKISVGPDRYGRPKLLLNNEVLFQYGLLDQGWWPDGLLTAPTDEALLYDIELTKALGFNMIRKHVKVEPARWYYHCDRLGLLVWQDMPNGNPPIGPRAPLWVRPWHEHDAERSPESARQFEDEMRRMIDALYNHPSIVVWVPFNEGWGQYDTARVTRWVQEYDPTRLTDAVSGWTDRGTGHMRDIHEYPGPAIETCDEGRVPVLGEFGGLALGMPGHLWTEDGNWGYRSYGDREALRREYAHLIKSLHGPLALGLAAAIYTQTTDVEREINGLITYDRQVLKLDEDFMMQLHKGLYEEAAPATVLVDTSEKSPQAWRVLEGAAEDGGDERNWTSPDYDDSDWTEAVGPFKWGQALRMFPDGTEWHGPELRLRRRFEVDDAARYSRLWLQVMCAADELTVYLNGQPVLESEEPRETRRHYRHIDISAHARLLRDRQNVLCVRAVKAEGDRGIDVGLYGV